MALRSLSIGSQAAASLTGIGSVFQTIYDPRFFGYVGDGVADDTAAVQSAITACAGAGGGVVRIPPGTTCRTVPATPIGTVGNSNLGLASWIIPSTAPVIIEGPGALIKVGNNVGPYHSIFYGRSLVNCLVRDLQINQNVLNNTLQPFAYAGAQRVFSFVDSCQHCHVQRVVVSKSHGIHTGIFDVVTSGMVNIDCTFETCFSYFQMTSPADYDNTSWYVNGSGGAFYCTAMTDLTVFGGATNPVSITAVTYDSTNHVATVTCSGAHGFNKGQNVVVNGTGLTYDGTWPVADPGSVTGAVFTTTQFSYTYSTATAAFTAPAVSNATWSAGVATLTTSAPHGLTAGQAVRVTGITVASGGNYNGTFILASASGSTLTYALPATAGTYSSGGAASAALTGPPRGGGRTGFEVQGLQTHLSNNHCYNYLSFADATGGQGTENVAGQSGNGECVITGNIGKGLAIGLTVWQSSAIGPVIIANNEMEMNQGVSITDPQLGTVLGHNYYQTFGIQIEQAQTNGGANQLIVANNALTFADEGAGRSVDAVGNATSAAPYGISLNNQSNTTDAIVEGNIINGAPGIGIQVGFNGSANYIANPGAFQAAPSDGGAGGAFAASATNFGYTFLSAVGETQIGGKADSTANPASFTPTLNDLTTMGITLSSATIAKVGIYVGTAASPTRIGTIALSYNSGTTTWTVGAIAYDSPNSGLITSATVNGANGLTTVLTVVVSNVSAGTHTAPAWDQTIATVYNTRIADNAITNPGQNLALPTTSRAGIVLAGNLVNVHAVDNQMQDTWSTTRASYGVFAATAEGFFQNVSVRNSPLSTLAGTTLPNSLAAGIQTGYTYLTPAGGTLAAIDSVGPTLFTLNAQTGQRAAQIAAALNQTGLNIAGNGTGKALIVTGGVNGTAAQIIGGGGTQALLVQPGAGDLGIKVVAPASGSADLFRLTANNGTTILAGIDINGNLTLADAASIIAGSTTGLRVGTATTQKLGFFNSAPVVQPSGDVATALSALGLVASPTVASSPHASSHRIGGSDVVDWASIPSHPTTNNFTFWSEPFGSMSSFAAQSSGVPIAIKIPTPYAFTCNNLFIYIQTAASGLIGGQNAISLYDSTGASKWRSSTYTVTTPGGVGGNYVVSDALTQTATSGTGSGFTATVASLGAGGVATLATTAPGTGYRDGDTVTLSNAHGGTNAVITMRVDNATYALMDTIFTATGLKTVATGGISCTTAFHWASVMANGTPPALLATPGIAIGAINMNVSTATSRMAVLPSATVPLSSFTPGSQLTQSVNRLYFAAVN